METGSQLHSEIVKKKSEKKPTLTASGRRNAAPKRIKASLELALLGLIAEQRLPSGYDLVQLFRVSMVHYWHAHPGQIYPTLERMEHDGWISGREVIQKGRPNKRVYSITTKGREVLVEWLQSPFEPFKMKNSPLLRSRFLGHLGAEGARDKLLETRAATKEYLELLHGYDLDIATKGGAYSDVNMMFVYFTLKRGIDFARAEMEFCDWAIAEIDRHKSLFDRSPKSASENPPMPMTSGSRSRAS